MCTRYCTKMNHSRQQAKSLAWKETYHHQPVFFHNLKKMNLSARMLSKMSQGMGIFNANVDALVSKKSPIKRHWTFSLTCHWMDYVDCL